MAVNLVLALVTGDHCIAACHFLMLCRRPGILVLINDTDWELTGQLQTLVEDGDTVTFISTLHGG